jgi:hypothetical protein
MAHLAQSFKRALPELQANAQLIGATAGILGTVSYVVYSTSRAFSAAQLENAILKERLEKEAELRKSQIEAAVANSEKRTLDRFLTYGFAEEYQRLRRKTIEAQAKGMKD